MKRYRFIYLLVFLIGIPTSNAQVISPGELILDHEPWDALENCTSCHELGTRGVAPDKCLSCHTPLRDRIDLELGLHSTFDEPNCASCHKDHFGRDFDSIRFDTTSFDHGLTGYDLLQSHEEVSCISCHESDNQVEAEYLNFRNQHSLNGESYLGLDETCESCHASDGVHGDQFLLDTCSSCHDADAWTIAPLFDHDESDYPLTGEHIPLECASCHKPSPADPDVVLYSPLEFAECSNCHEDEHQGAFGPTCMTCHVTTGWNTIAADDFESTFDHSTTEFPLIGSHQSATCASCHSASSESPGIELEFIRSTLGNTYPHPVGDTCQNCHEDAHVGTTEETSCASCHTEFGWDPSEFDVFRHQDETDYPLEGAHMAVLCSQCHNTGTPTASGYTSLPFEVLDQTCEGCHSTDNPHEEQFSSSTCASCHDTNAWEEVTDTFDHNATLFPLTGSHTLASCASCHTPVETGSVLFEDLSSTCISCHEPDNPHLDQFDDTTCATCHDDVSFRISVFDHESTSWPLDGAHEKVACTSCHFPTLDTEVVQFRGIGTLCEDCHGGNKTP